MAFILSFFSHNHHQHHLSVYNSNSAGTTKYSDKTDLYSTSRSRDVSLNGSCEVRSSKLFFLRLFAFDDRYCQKVLVDVGIAVENVVDLNTRYTSTQNTASQPLVSRIKTIHKTGPDRFSKFCVAWTSKSVSWCLTSFFSTNVWLYQGRKNHGWRAIPTQYRKASDILTSTLAAFLFSSHPKMERDREAHLNYYTSADNRERQLHTTRQNLVQ